MNLSRRLSEVSGYRVPRAGESALKPWIGNHHAPTSPRISIQPDLQQSIQPQESVLPFALPHYSIFQFTKHLSHNYPMWCPQQLCQVDRTRIIILILKPGKLRLQRPVGYSSSCKIQVKIKTSSDPALSAFNPAFLQDNLLMWWEQALP